VLLGLLIAISACDRKTDTKPDAQVPPSAPAAKLSSVGPRLISNQTSQPIAIVADALDAQSKLVLGPPINQAFAIVAVDARHGYARLPANLELGLFPEAVVEAKVSGVEGKADLRFINDTRFPDVTSMVTSGEWAFAASTTTDTLYRVHLGTGAVESFTVADGPAALAVWHEGKTDWVVVTHLYSPVVLLLRADAPAERRELSGALMSAGVTVANDVAFIAEQARDSVLAVELKTGREKWRATVAPNPRELAVLSAPSPLLAVGSIATGAIELLELETGKVTALHEPGPGTPIVGGGTAKYAAYVMNGKAPRKLAWAASLKQLFVASIGPNIGPNPDKMEVSMNGGVGVVDPVTGWKRHLGFGAGVIDALAVDDAHGLLYAGDDALGLVRVIDSKLLSKSDGDAAKALLQEVALRPPANFPLARPAADYNVQNRAGPSIHAGPKALALSADGKTLVVLERFTCTLAVIDVSKRGKAEWKKQLTVCDPLTQPTRRLGQVLYHADLGRTAMSCDACHIDGHGEGVLFEKTMPLRIYRSTTVRGSRETPPYFTPASTRSMGETMKVVGGRNRFHNPDPTPEEIEALTLYGSLIPTLPNPFAGADGAPAESLSLPDGRVGHPRRGLALFEGKAACASCHPAPLFTMDQDPATRGRFIDVGTPHFMPLREEMQNTRFEGFGTPSLVGSWDVFPMLTTGLAGLEVRSDGAVRVNTRFPLRVAVEQWAGKHGRADLLSAEEKDDLLAYVMSL